MTLEVLKNSAKLFIDGKLGAEEFSAIFVRFYKMYFDYQKIRKQDANLAELIETINENVSRYESYEGLRKQQPDYYIDDYQLRNIVKNLLNYDKTIVF